MKVYVVIGRVNCGGLIDEYVDSVYASEASAQRAIEGFKHQEAERIKQCEEYGGEVEDKLGTLEILEMDLID